MYSEKSIYLVRHGETECNKLGIVQGRGVNADLNEMGQLQASAFFNHYKHIAFDTIYTSTLKRTHQSVAQFIHQNPSWEQLEGLDEISWGVKEGRKVSEEDDEQYFAMLSGWKRGEYHWKVEGGESPVEVLERQKKAWHRIMSKSDDKTVLVCMHGRAIRILMCFLFNVPLSDMDRFKHQNLCLYRINYSKGQYHMQDENNTAHLEGLDEFLPHGKGLVKV